MHGLHHCSHNKACHLSNTHCHFAQRRSLTARPRFRTRAHLSSRSTRRRRHGTSLRPSRFRYHQTSRPLALRRNASILASAILSSHDAPRPLHGPGRPISDAFAPNPSTGRPAPSIRGQRSDHASNSLKKIPPSTSPCSLPPSGSVILGPARSSFPPSCLMGLRLRSVRGLA